MTPQYSSLVALYDKYKSKGFEIIAFPCNAFGKQESGENCEIKAFAQRKGAKFTMLEKGEVNGPNEAPLYTFLKDKKGGLLGKDIPWNFSKFLVDKKGTVVKRFAPTDDPLNFEKDIVAVL
jgi:glutathione peroxidase